MTKRQKRYEFNGKYLFVVMNHLRIEITGQQITTNQAFSRLKINQTPKSKDDLHRADVSIFHTLH